MQMTIRSSIFTGDLLLKTSINNKYSVSVFMTFEMSQSPLALIQSRDATKNVRFESTMIADLYLPELEIRWLSFFLKQWLSVFVDSVIGVPSVIA